MDFYKILFAILMLKWGHASGVGQDDGRWLDKKPEVETLTQIFVDTAKPGVLIDPDTDAMLLATQAWYESALKLKPKDGDPLRLHDGDVGTVVGPMQVSKAAPGWVVLLPGLGHWKGLNVEKMRDPATNVRLAYDIIKYWKDTCGGPPGVWLTAYGWGRCPTQLWNGNRTVDWEGKRRCKTLTWMMKEAAKEGYKMPDDWQCVTKK
jgi:hypothetical protein